MGGTLDKAKARLMSEPNDYTFNDARQLLIALGYIEHNKGKTSGSRIMFYKPDVSNSRVLLHKPHPGNEMKRYAVKQLKEHLMEMGDL